MGIQSVAIIGLGLIGGSFAKAIHEKLPRLSVGAVDRNPDFLSAALAEGTISQGSVTLTRGICVADLVLVCVPIEATADTLREIAGFCGERTIVADAASVNGYPIKVAEGLGKKIRYLSTHPMAGGEKGGYFESKKYLFENAYAILSPSELSDDEAIEDVSAFYGALGAIPVRLPAQAHDHAAGVISHIPHFAAAALVNLLSEEDDAEKTIQSFAAGGFKDITRIASSSSAMWSSIASLNQEQILPLLEKYIRILEQVKGDLASGRECEVAAFFENAKKLRDTVISTAPKAKFQQLYEVHADVEDRVGAIRIVAEILSRENVSMKNINVANAREEGEGVLTLAFSTEEDAVKAAEVLNRNHIKAGVKG